MSHCELEDMGPQLCQSINIPVLAIHRGAAGANGVVGVDIEYNERIPLYLGQGRDGGGHDRVGAWDYHDEWL